MEKKTALPVAFLVPVFLILIVAAPVAFAISPVFLVESLPLKIALATISPFAFSFFFVLLAGLLSLPFHKAIVPGKFPRNVTHFVYGPRRLYGLLWCAVFYFTPLYYAFISVPTLRKFLFRIFGYRGHPDVTVAPDAWIRDLPCLRFSKGVYTANKCTIGTNMCLSNGSILVDYVTLGAGATIGHLAMVAPGATLGAKTEVGVGGAIGIRARLGDRCSVGPTTTINHGAQLGNDVDVGTMSYVGVKARIADGLKIPSGTNVPEGMEIKTKEELDQLTRTESQNLREERLKLETLYSSRLKNLSA